MLAGFKRRPRKRPTPQNTGLTQGANLARQRTVDLPCRLFFTNVRFDIDESALKPFFASVGTVRDCKIIRDSFTGQSKGWGFVTFTDPLYATTALRSLNGLPIEGRPIILDEATSLARRRKEKRAKEGFERREAKRRAAERDAIDAGAERKDAAASPAVANARTDTAPPPTVSGFGA